MYYIRQTLSKSRYSVLRNDITNLDTKQQVKSRAFISAYLKDMDKIRLTDSNNYDLKLGEELSLSSKSPILRWISQ